MLQNITPTPMGVGARSRRFPCRIQHLGQRTFLVEWDAPESTRARRVSNDGGLSWTTALSALPAYPPASSRPSDCYALRSGARVPGVPPVFPSAPLIVSRGPAPWRDIAIADESPTAKIEEATMAVGQEELVVAYLAQDNGHEPECRVLRVSLGHMEAGLSSWREMPVLPDTIGLAGLAVGSHGGALLAAGGANFPGLPPWEGGQKMSHREIRVFTRSREAWSEAGLLPEPRAYAACVTTPKGVVVAGGENAQTIFRDCLLLRWNGHAVEITSLPDLPAPRAHAAAALVEGKLYIAGGYSTLGNRRSETTFWCLDLHGPEVGWRELPTWPGASRAQAVAAASDGKFFLFSGQSNEPGPDGKLRTEFLRDAYRFQTGAGWRKLRDLPWSTVAAPSPAPVLSEPSGIFLLGGVDGTQVGQLPRSAPLPDDILHYDVQRDTWRLWPAPWPHAVVCVSAVPWDRGWVFVSGESGAGRRTFRVLHWTPQYAAS